MSNKHVKALVLASISNGNRFPLTKPELQGREIFICTSKSASGNSEDDEFVRAMIYEDYFQSIDDIIGIPVDKKSVFENSKFSHHLQNGLYVFTCNVWASEYHGPDGSDYDCGIDVAESVRPFAFTDYQFFFGGEKP